MYNTQQQNNILIANGTIKSVLMIFVIQIPEEDERESKIFFKAFEKIIAKNFLNLMKIIAA